MWDIMRAAKVKNTIQPKDYKSEIFDYFRELNGSAPLLNKYIDDIVAQTVQ